MTLSKTVFADYLDVTYAPDSCPSFLELAEFLVGLGALPCKASRYGDVVVSWGGGTAVFSACSRFAKVSLSGGLLAMLREGSRLDEFLCLLSEYPYRITRLDAAMDVALDGAKAVRAAFRRFPDGVTLSRKKIPTTRVLGRRWDGVESGTVYFGNRRTTYSFKVYDKSKEVYDRTRVQESVLRTRYELTGRRVEGLTFRDVALPSAWFWSVVGGVVLPVPDGVSEWVPGDVGGWTRDVVSNVTVWEKAERLVRGSPDLDYLARFLASDPSCKKGIVRLLLSELDRRIAELFRGA